MAEPRPSAAISRSPSAVPPSAKVNLILGLPTTPEQVQALIALYNGTLLTLVVAPPETLSQEAARALARCLVTGVLVTTASSRAGEA